MYSFKSLNFEAVCYTQESFTRKRLFFLIYLLVLLVNLSFSHCDYNEPSSYIRLKKYTCRSTWVAQSVERQTLDFGSVRDLTVGELEPCNRLCVTAQSRLGLSLSLSAPPLFMLSFSLSLPK